MATKKVYYLAEEQPASYGEANFPIDIGEAIGYESEASEPRCSICHELLAWHEQACLSEETASVRNEQAALKTGVAAQTYAYDIGLLVQPVRQAQVRTVIWRGQLKERHPQTGLVHRVNVYRLDDNFWDCYHEEELQMAA